MQNNNSKNSSINSKRLKQNDYYYKYIMKPMSSSQDFSRGNETFIPFSETQRPSIESRRSDYLEKLSSEEYIRSDPVLQARLGLRDHFS